MKIDGCGALENKDNAQSTLVCVCVCVCVCVSGEGRKGDNGVGWADMSKAIIANIWMAQYSLQVLAHPLSHLPSPHPCELLLCPFNKCGI